MAALNGKLNTDFSNADLNKANIVLQRVFYPTGGYSSTTAVIPFDDTIPQINEGAQLMSASITPKSTNSKIDVDITLHVTCYNGATWLLAAAFKDSAPDAIVSGVVTNGGAGQFETLRLRLPALQLGDTAAHTISVRVGTNNNSYPISVNGQSSRLLGGSLVSSIVLTEYGA
ncbi:hypothetical protein [Desulfovibrio sp.]|uniref:hypothetical protein n=1 Tax=Desulfovibrio sp. TaxID=885 RepID=UPI0035B1701A